MNNYFKVAGCFVFIRDIQQAWKDATDISKGTGERVWLYKAINVPRGPWSECPIIGHRPIEDIRADMSDHTLSSEDLDLLEAELDLAIEAMS